MPVETYMHFLEYEIAENGIPLEANHLLYTFYLALLSVWL